MLALLRENAVKRLIDVIHSPDAVDDGLWRAVFGQEHVANYLYCKSSISLSSAFHNSHTCPNYLLVPPGNRFESDAKTGGLFVNTNLEELNSLV